MVLYSSRVAFFEWVPCFVYIFPLIPYLMMAYENIILGFRTTFLESDVVEHRDAHQSSKRRRLQYK